MKLFMWLSAAILLLILTAFLHAPLYSIEFVNSDIENKITGDSGIDNFSNYDIEDLMNIKVTVASKKAQHSMKVPSIVTVITRNDIKLNHCRDMVDVLNMVPGFQIVGDIGAISYSVRGLYASEGRNLFMVNGLTMSDLKFGGFFLGNELPVNMIERVEIIRGPGSAVYGGMAELAVINVIMEDGSQLNGGRIALRGGMLTTPAAFGHADGSFAYGEKLENVEYSMIGFYSMARRSNGSFLSFHRNPEFTYTNDMDSVSTLFLSGKITINENTELKLLYHRYKFLEIKPSTTPELYSRNIITGAHNITTVFETAGIDLSHKFVVNEYVSITPSVNCHYSLPWHVIGTGYEELPSLDIYVARIKPSLYGVFDWKFLYIEAGGEVFWDSSGILHTRDVDATTVAQTGFRRSPNDTLHDSITIWNYALYTNATFGIIEDESLKLNAVGGIRYDRNAIYGDKLNPRCGITLQWEDFHAKILYSSAFRAPLIGNNAYSAYGIDPNKPWRTEVKPEWTRIGEIELGYKVSKNLLVTVNSFVQRIDSIIEYRYNASQNDFYSNNGGTLGTYGVEMEMKFVSTVYNGLVNVSWYKPIFYSRTNPYAYSLQPYGGDTYIDPEHQNRLMGVSSWKIYTNHSVHVTKDISGQLNLLYMSAKRATKDIGSTRKIRDQVIAGMGVIWNRFFVDSLDLALSVHDLFNQRLNIVAPYYDSGYDVLPYKGREISLTLSYQY